MAAISVALDQRWAFEQIKEAVASLVPVRRRFERVCEQGDIIVISDYAHHPTEIKHVIQTAKLWDPKRLVVVFQPHRYTRTRALIDEFPAAFRDVDKLVLTPVYAASEKPLAGGTSRDLYDLFISRKFRGAAYAETLAEAWQSVRCDLKKGDMLLFWGAGDVDIMARWAREDPTLNPRLGR